MRKLLIALIIGLMVIVAGCDDKEGAALAENKTGQQIEAAIPEVDKGIFNVEITLPKDLFEGQKFEDIEKGAKESGIDKVVKNGDGSITYVMSKEVHEKLLADLKDQNQKEADKIVSENSAIFTAISMNDDCTAIEAKVKTDAVGFNMLGVEMGCMFYQAYNGVPWKETKVTITLIDSVSGSVLSTTEFPESDK